MGDLNRPYYSFRKQLTDSNNNDDRVLFALNNLETIKKVYVDHAIMKDIITTILRSGSKTINKAPLKQFLQSVKFLYKQASLFDKVNFDKRLWKMSFGADVRKIRSEAIAAFNMLGELKRTIKTESTKEVVDILKNYLTVWADFVRVLQQENYV
jgi:hypothetical protein